MNESKNDSLQAMVEYYRNKSNQLEYDFLNYKIQAELTIEKLLSKSTEPSIEKPDA